MIKHSNRSKHRQQRAGEKAEMEAQAAATVERLEEMAVRDSRETMLLLKACAVLEANNLLSPELREWWMAHKPQASGPW
jgi:hypothetical protein